MIQIHPIGFGCCLPKLMYATKIFEMSLTSQFLDLIHGTINSNDAKSTIVTALSGGYTIVVMTNSSQDVTIVIIPLRYTESPRTPWVDQAI